MRMMCLLGGSASLPVVMLLVQASTTFAECPDTCRNACVRGIKNSRCGLACCKWMLEQSNISIQPAAVMTMQSAFRLMHLWKCPPHVSSTSSAVIVYALGPSGRYMARSAFEFLAADSDIGVLYYVQDSKSSPINFDGAIISYRNCTSVRPIAGNFHSTDQRKIRHYSGRYDMAKLDVHHHLIDEEKVVLIDSDSYVLPSLGRRVTDVFANFSSTAFVGGSQLYANGGGEGINSGFLLLHLHRLRNFERQYCPGKKWYECVSRYRENNGIYHDNTDQGMWNSFLIDNLEYLHALPCGFHAHIDIMRSFLIGMVNVSMSCPKYKLRNLECSELNPRNFAQTTYKEEPVVFHGAARLQPMARLCAMLFTSDAKKRQLMFSKYPCYCLSFVGAADERVWMTASDAPNPTGCQKWRPS